ncbi:MAG: Holliday junction DNA helicase RuvB C-terminal domain-containing protein, partial [Campylobacterales bacterium]
RRARDLADVADQENINHKRTNYALDELGITKHGFDEVDIKLLKLLISNKGRPMGLSTIAAALSEDEGTIEDVLEPYLLANGYLERTSKGRKATRETYNILNMPIDSEQGTLF